MSPDPLDLATIIKSDHPKSTVYEEFYRKVHQNPELSGLETETADLVATHLHQLGLTSVPISAVTELLLCSKTAREKPFLYVPNLTHCRIRS
jgi:metal-dependent amidase/aminoacylase/carboxypeptidase family protein